MSLSSTIYFIVNCSLRQCVSVVQDRKLRSRVFEDKGSAIARVCQRGACFSRIGSGEEAELLSSQRLVNGSIPSDCLWSFHPSPERPVECRTTEPTIATPIERPRRKQSRDRSRATAKDLPEQPILLCKSIIVSSRWIYHSDRLSPKSLYVESQSTF